MATDLGTTISAFPDLHPGFALVTGRTALAQRIAMRLETPEGGLFYDPSYGAGIPQRLSSEMTTASLREIQAQVQYQCLLDEEVDAALVEVTFVAPTRTLTIRIGLVDAAGPFELVLSVSAVSVEILRVGT